MPSAARSYSSLLLRELSGCCLYVPQGIRSPLAPAPATHWTDYLQHGCWRRRSQRPRKLRRGRRRNSHRETPKTQQVSSTLLSRCSYVLFSVVAIVFLRLRSNCFVSKTSVSFSRYYRFLSARSPQSFTEFCQKTQEWLSRIKIAFLVWYGRLKLFANLSNMSSYKYPYLHGFIHPVSSRSWRKVATKWAKTSALSVCKNSKTAKHIFLIYDSGKCH